MCICNGNETEHCEWHKRLQYLYDLATGMTESEMFSPPEINAALKDAQGDALPFYGGSATHD